jgi:hypothetical protein
MPDLSHLNALTIRLNNERARLAKARHHGNANEVTLRTAWIAQVEKEITAEEKLLGIDASDITISDDELLAALSA